jgi:large subunit ribosomal protein L25
MKTAQLSGSPRVNVGKKDAAALRRAEQVPCVLYGLGEQTHFSVRRIDMEKLVFSPEVYKIELEIDGKKTSGIIRELQQHPLTGIIQHVDFLELSDSKPVRVGLPVRLTGSSRGVMAGGKLMQTFRRLQVVGLPQDLPEAIVLDISKLKIGKSIRVGSIEIPGVKFLDPANAVVVAVKMARGAIKPADDDDDEDDE